MHASMKPHGMPYALGLVSQPFMPRNKNVWHLATVWVHSLDQLPCLAMDNLQETH